MNIPDEVMREAFYDFPQIPGRLYGDYISRGAEVIAEWARKEALREAAEAVAGAFKRANDDSHESLCSCPGYPDRCVTYPIWERVEVYSLDQDAITSAIRALAEGSK